MTKTIQARIVEMVENEPGISSFYIITQIRTEFGCAKGEIGKIMRNMANEGIIKMRNVTQIYMVEE